MNKEKIIWVSIPLVVMLGYLTSSWFTGITLLLLLGVLKTYLDKIKVPLILLILVISSVLLYSLSY